MIVKLHLAFPDLLHVEQSFKKSNLNHMFNIYFHFGGNVYQFLARIAEEYKICTDTFSTFHNQFW